jgi:predicted P-loop ATPase
VGVVSHFDFAPLSAALLQQAEAFVAQWLQGGRREGREWKAGDLTGAAGRSVSVNLATGMWSDFATGDKGGDLVSLYAAIKGCSQIEAARQLAPLVGMEPPAKPGGVPNQSPTRAAMPPPPPAPPPAPEVRRSDWRAITPVPAWAPQPPLAHSHRGKPALTWRYMRDGQLLGLVCRFVTSEGGKEVLPLTWCVNDHDTEGRGGQRWHWKTWEVPRPLYLPHGALRTEVPKVVVEGEKCAQKLAGLLPDMDVVSWPGGGKAVPMADWAWLAGEKVYLWADADSKRRKATDAEKAANVDPDTLPLLPTEKQPGAAAMLKLAEKLSMLGCQVWLVPLQAPGLLPDGWDCADAIDGIGVPAPWGPEQLQAHLATAQRWQAPPAVLNEAAKVLERAAAGISTPTAAPAGGVGLPLAGQVVTGWPHYGQSQPKATRENILHAMRRDVALIGLVGLNEFSHQVFKLRATPWPSRPGVWQEVDDYKLAEYLVTRFEWSGSPSGEALAQALKVVAGEHAFHPVRERYEVLVWDGTPLLDEWLFIALGQQRGAMTSRRAQYIAHVGRWFLMGMVRRAMEPGCKFDYMLVLEGPQGFRKSTLGRVLAGEYFSDTHLNLGDKDSYLQLQGRTLHEFSELHSLNGKDVTLVKAFVSSTTDYLRAPFDKRPAEYPRQCVFFGTSNNAKWARDRSGNRRFWPIEITQPIDTDWVAAHVDQLLAEAVVRVKAGERCYPTHEEERQWFMPEQAKRVQSTATEEALFQYLCGNRNSKGATSVELPLQVTLVGCLENIGLDVAKSASNRMVQSEVIELLHKWGWQHKRASKAQDGVRPWVYVRPAVWPPKYEDADAEEAELAALPDLPHAPANHDVQGEDDDVPF